MSSNISMQWWTFAERANFYAYKGERLCAHRSLKIVLIPIPAGNGTGKSGGKSRSHTTLLSELHATQTLLDCFFGVSLEIRITVCFYFGWKERKVQGVFFCTRRTRLLFPSPTVETCTISKVSRIHWWKLDDMSRTQEKKRGKSKAMRLIGAMHWFFFRLRSRKSSFWWSSIDTFFAIRYQCKQRLSTSSILPTTVELLTA